MQRDRVKIRCTKAARLPRTKLRKKIRAAASRGSGSADPVRRADQAMNYA